MAQETTIQILLIGYKSGALRSVRSAVMRPAAEECATEEMASGFGPKTKARYSLSFIAGVGALTPLNAQKSVQVFKINSSITERFPGAAPPKEFIAFVSPDRTRFLRQYFGGLRLKTYFVKADPGIEDPFDLEPIFPGVIDVTFGQNEAVTRGRFRGGVVRVEGIYPLPFKGNNNKGLIYAFGSVQMKLTSAKIEKPIFLQWRTRFRPFQLTMCLSKRFRRLIAISTK